MQAGVQEEQESRKAANKPLLKVPMTSELGNATPILVTPGHLNKADLKLLAQKISENIGMNAGCNCLSPKMILFPDEWHQVCLLKETMVNVGVLSLLWESHQLCLPEMCIGLFVLSCPGLW
jgi:hypothetical protein